MAIYKNGDIYYLNGVANPLSQNRLQELTAYTFKPQRFLNILQIFRCSLVAQCMLAVPLFGYAFIKKLTHDPVSFETISVLAVMISAPVLVTWISTLTLRNGVSTFSLSDVDYQLAPSSSYYRFYALSGLNLFFVFISAPWGDGWYLPVTVAPTVGLFAIVTVFASYRFFRQPHQTK